MATEVRALGAWANDPRVKIGVSGARPQAAETEARRLVAEGCDILLSWGIAGGLDPVLRPGDLIAPDTIVDEYCARWQSEPSLHSGLLTPHSRTKMAEGQRASSCLLGSERMILSSAGKAALRARTGAVVVDMESHRVAMTAIAANIPFVVVRAIGDPAERALPDIVSRAISADGRPRLAAIAPALLRRPWEIAALIRLKRDTDAALASLSRVADRVIAQILGGR